MFRLYTKDEHDEFRTLSVPEIQRSNLAQAVLQLKALGIRDVMSFGWVTPPSAELVAHALEVSD